MKKVFTLNRVEGTIPTTCCNVLKKIDQYEHRNSEKLFLEKKITSEFNRLGSNGYQYEDSKVFGHNLFVENSYKGMGQHGVYRFKNSENNNTYQFYFGPLIKVDVKSLGCGSVGCNLKNPGCKMKGLSCKSVGCSDKGGNNVQHLNFLNDSKNIEEVSILNKHFGLRKLFNRDQDDYLYLNKKSVYIALSEYVKDNFELINQQFEKDVATFHNQGLKFESIVDTPSYTDMFSQGILFSSHGKEKIALADSALSVDGHSVYLSRFDLWYFPKVKGLISQILEVLYLVPVLGWILKFFFGKKEKDIVGTDIISDENLEKLTKVYEDDLNEQEQREAQYNQELSNLQEQYLSKIPVTIAVRNKTGWFNRLLNGESYTFYSYLANGVKK